MLPRLLLFRKADRLTLTFGSQKWHCSSRNTSPNSFRLNNSYSTFFPYAAFGLTIFSLSTLYVFNRRHKVTAAAHKSKSSPKCQDWDFNWDNLPLAPNNSTRSYTLIRHGQYIHAVIPSNKVLSDLGKKQAKITGQTLKSTGIKYDEIICSEMVRAKQTANIISNELYPKLTKEQMNIKYDSNLNEGAPARIIPERDDINKSGFWDKLDSDSDRISKAFESYIHRNDNKKDKQILIIGHGNVFRYFMCRVLQIPNECWLRFSICNCGVTKFKVFADGRVSVECIGSDGHFTKRERTFN